MDAYRTLPPTLATTNDVHILTAPKVRAKSPALSISPVSEFGPSVSPPPLSPPESPTARSRRIPARNPPVNLTSTSLEHTLDVWLPKELRPEMVTVSAKKGNKLDVVADIWHQEKDSHYEWEIMFPPRDVDMSSIRVDLSNGHLTIRARRLQRRSGSI